MISLQAVQLRSLLIFHSRILRLMLALNLLLQKAHFTQKDSSTAVYSDVNISAHVGKETASQHFLNLINISAPDERSECIKPWKCWDDEKFRFDSNKIMLSVVSYWRPGYGHNGCIKGYLSNMFFMIRYGCFGNYYDAGEWLYISWWRRNCLWSESSLQNVGFRSRMALGYPVKYWVLSFSRKLFV